MKGRKSIFAASLLAPWGLSRPVEVQVQAGIVVDILPSSSNDSRALAGVLVPGLVDAHVHMVFDPSAEDVVATARDGTDDDVLALIQQNSDRALARGVTTLRDLGDRGNLVKFAADRARQTGVPFVRVTRSGTPLTSPRGHCSFLGGEVTSTETIAAAIQMHASEGAEWLKLMVGGGYLTPGSDPLALQFSTSDICTVSRLGRQAGLRTAAHAHSTAAIRAAVEAGFDSIEHCTFQVGTHLEHEVSDFQLHELAESRILVCPTTARRPGVAQDSTRLLWRVGLIGRMYAAGVNLVNGTDAGVFQGLDTGSAAFGVLTMIEAGVPPLEAIALSSWKAWERLGLAGPPPLQPGSPADFMLVEDDPLSNPNTLTEPLQVWVGGQPLRGHSNG